MLLIHGISLTNGVDCGTYGWNDVEYYLSQSGGHTVNGHSHISWTGRTYTIGYYAHDTNCDINLNLTGDPATKCQNYPSTGDPTGDNNDPIENLACELAWFIYDYSVASAALCPGDTPPCNVDIVDHSMGGLIARWALAESRPNNAPFPPSLLYVHDVVDFDTPNNGANLAFLCPRVCPVYEATQMAPGSAFITALNNDAPYPQGAQGTNWILMGAAAAVFPCIKGQVVGAASATHMQEPANTPGGVKIWYKWPCYDHALPGIFGMTMMNDLSDTFNAQVLYCLSCGSSDPRLTSYGFPHTLLAMLYGLTDQPLIPQRLPPPPSPTPTPAPPVTGLLEGIAAVSASDVWAVGYATGAVDRTLIEHWDGLRWRVVPSANVGSGNNFLYSVAAVSAGNVWAVGATVDGSGYNRTLVEHFDGILWSVVPSMNPGSGNNGLASVAAVSATDVWAAGSQEDASTGITQTLIEQWDGTSWNVVSSPNPNPADSGYLAGVTAVAPNDVWTVGAYDASNAQLTLIEHWDGTSWNVVSSPNASSAQNSLYGVAAVSASDVWAVGTFNVGTQTLTEHWDGSNWAIVASPNPGASFLQAVTQVATNDVWVVGSTAPTQFGVHQTLIEHWDGTTWSVVSSPNVGSGANNLYGVATVSASDIWAVGFEVTSTGSLQTLIEQWNGTQWSVVPSP